MRKTLQFILCLFATSLGASTLMAGTGGPDAYGYIWKDSNEPDLSYSWIDITGLPGAVQVTGLADDNAVGPFSIGFDFHYYWSSYNEVKVGSNGWISFDNVGNIASCFPTIPTAGGAGDNVVAPYMSDLNFLSGYPNMPNVGEMWYWTNNTDSFVIQYVNVPWWKNDNGGANPPDWTGSNTFQLVLSAVDSSITFNYQDTDAANFQPGGNCPTSMEIGMENVTGNIGLSFMSGTNLPGDMTSVKYYYPGTVLLAVPDATPAWGGNADNAGQFIFTNIAQDMMANIANVGNADITTAINVDGELESLALQQIWSDASSIAGLTAGADQTITFANQATVATAGQYYYRLATSNGQDINPSNNDNTVEISAVDNTGGAATFSYATGNPPDGAISWAGGGINDGCAIEIVPPIYPTTITSVEMFILGDDQDPNTPVLNGFTVEIYDEAMGGGPGAIIGTETMTPADITEDDWNTINMTTPVVVTSGSFFVAWLQGGSGIALGTEAFGPISRRSYEILGGAWAPYRQNSVEDYLIKVNTTIPVGIEGPDMADAMNFTAFPNPSTGVLTNVNYELAANGDVSFKVTNQLGQTVWSKHHGLLDAGSYQFQIDTEHFAPGIYFVTMRQDDQTLTRKLVVQ